MSFSDAIRILENFKHQGIVRDYVIIGAIAATAYMEPVFTEDLDIVVLVDTDEEYLSLFRRIGELAEGREGMHYVLGSMPVQMFPSTVKPLYRDTLESARMVRLGELTVKVATAEHLILLYLEAFRAKDKFRIGNLLQQADQKKLDELLKRFDHEGALTRKLETLR